MQPPFRIGLGYDIHPLVAGRRCVLGGVVIDSPVGPDGHSDADVILHAVADAVLGAAGLPDIGQLFPNTDPSLRGLDSARIIERAVKEAAAKGWAVGNLDLVVLAERPKLARLFRGLMNADRFVPTDTAVYEPVRRAMLEAG